MTFSELTLTRAGTDQPLERTPLSLLAPGLYQARLHVPALGSYTLDATLAAPDRPSLRAFGSFGHALPDEYRRLTPDLSRLETLSRSTGGGALRDVRQAFAGGAPLGVPIARWPLLIWGALFGFVADVAVRRLGVRRRGRRSPKTVNNMPYGN